VWRWLLPRPKNEYALTASLRIFQGWRPWERAHWQHEQGPAAGLTAEKLMFGLAYDVHSAATGAGDIGNIAVAVMEPLPKPISKVLP
jgi:hypothetical protein